MTESRCVQLLFVPDTELISTPFTASSTAADVVKGLDLTGVRAVVTGASSGIGIETVRALAGAGAQVTMAVRNTDAGQAVAEDIHTTTGGRPPGVLQLDLADLTSVASFTEAWQGPLHLLINNAGLFSGSLKRTHQNWELQFATNHLGHFALANGLHAALAQGAAERDEARIVSVSSGAHLRSGIDFDDIHFDRRSYEAYAAYGQSKTANSLFAVEATRRWAAAGIFTNAVHPGVIITGLQRDFTPEQKAAMDAAEVSGAFRYKTTEQGAATTMVAAVSQEFSRTGGHYLADAREAYTLPNDADPAQHPEAVRQWALDPADAERLWTVSTDLLQL